MSNRNAEFESHQHVKRVSRHVCEIEAVDFFNLLTGPALLEMTDSYLPEHRERLYPPTVTLSMFMMQALNEDSSCQKAVAGWAAQRTAEGLGVKSVNTGAYCKARYPQPNTQAPGVGFPLARLVGVMCLSTGALIDAAIGPHAGKETGELGLLRRLGSAFLPGDVMLADALYCSYFLIATLQRAGVDVLFAQQGSRITDFRRGEKLGTRDHRVSWPKPNVRPDWMSQQDYLAFPDQLTLREVQVGGKILVTTMLDPREVNKAQLSDLYRMRWNAELDLRNIKTTMGMDVLSCNTPQMNEKEVWVHLLAYNLTRLLMAQAATDAAVSPRQLSFKHTVQMWTEWVSRRLCSNRNGDIAVLFTLIAQIRVGNRPGRIEPRARKRRPKPYPWLKIPRAQARAQIAVHGHP